MLALQTAASNETLLIADSSDTAKTVKNIKQQLKFVLMAKKIMFLKCRLVLLFRFQPII